MPSKLRAALGCAPPNHVVSAPASCGHALWCVKERLQLCRSCVSTELLPSALAPISSRNHSAGPFRGCRGLSLAVGYEESHVVQPACGVHLSRPVQKQHPGKQRRQSGRVMWHPTLQPPGDRQCEARTCSLQEVAAGHSRSKCDHPGTLCREFGRGTCFHAAFMAS